MEIDRKNVKHPLNFEETTYDKNSEITIFNRELRQAIHDKTHTHKQRNNVKENMLRK